MPLDIIKFAFVGGEVSPNYYGRSDLAKFDLALAEAENWFVDYHGGLSTSPGLEFVDFVQNDTYPTKFYTFKFSSDLANTNVILFGHEYIRFIQDGAYVLETPKAIVSVTLDDPGVMEVTSHGFTAGEWVKPVATGEMVELAGRTLQVGTVTTHTFELLDPFGNNLDTSAFTTYVSGGTIARVYTLDSPYSAYDLELLRCHQIRDTLRFTHADYPIYNLERNDSADWTMALEVVGNNLTAVGTITLTTLKSGGWSTAFVITQVNQEGIESIASDYAFITNVTDYTNTDNGGAVLKWTPIAGAAYYKIYRTRVVRDTTALSRSYQVGYIGQSKGGHFADPGIIPDFAQTPPINTNPFANGRITYVDVTSGGSNYTNGSVVSVTDPNPSAGGFVGYAIVATTTVSSTGPIVGIIIVNEGHDYTNPSFSVTIGSGAVLEGHLGPATGNYPAISTVYQQRQLYAAPDELPLTIFGSKPGQLSNFSISEILIANDAFEHTLDSEDVSPLRHMLPTRGGLMVFNAAGVWLMSGSQGGAITATNVQADPQSSEGASQVVPLKVKSDILYCEATGGKVVQLSYNDQIKLYAGLDLSLLANHLIEGNKQIENWCYANEPFRQIWAQRSDGVMLNFTIIKEQEVFAWSRRLTRGKFTDVISLEEGNYSTVYAMVQRRVNGRLTKFIEKVSRRDFTHVEDAFCVDCGLKLGNTTPAADIQVAAATGTGIAVHASANVFVVGDVGKVIRAGGGKMTVASYVDANDIKVDIVRDITEVVPFSDDYPKLVDSGDWTMDTPVTSISGLTHLEGEEVKVLADGNVIEGLMVTNGAITLPLAATRVIIGLGYECTAKNLPMNIQGEVVENKQQRVMWLSMRVKDTRGLRDGNDLNDLSIIKERTDEAYGEPTRLLNGMTNLAIEPIWGPEGQSYLVQRDPLPATVLGYVIEAEVGDDSK